MQLVAHYYTGCSPGLTINHKIVNRLAGYSLAIDGDFYYLAENTQTTVESS